MGGVAENTKCLMSNYDPNNLKCLMSNYDPNNLTPPTT